MCLITAVVCSVLGLCVVCGVMSVLFSAGTNCDTVVWCGCVCLSVCSIRREMLWIVREKFA